MSEVFDSLSPVSSPSAVIVVHAFIGDGYNCNNDESVPWIILLLLLFAPPFSCIVSHRKVKTGSQRFSHGSILIDIKFKRLLIGEEREGL
jgi:hypothetical protein